MKSRHTYVIGNWKMNPMSLDAAKDVFRGIKKAAAKLDKATVIICPPSIYISDIIKLSKGAVPIGAQNAHFEQSGARTGEVSAEQLRDIGATHVIVGHSERRAAGEGDEEVSKKLAAVLRNGMTAVLCVGERERDETGAHLSFIEGQLKGSLAGIQKRDLSSLIIAYEPVWAIGSKSFAAMSGKDVHETVLYIRKVLAGLYGKDKAFEVPILYGGSVTSDNTGDIMGEGEADGLLVGRQSLDPVEFAKIAAIVDKR